MSFVRGIFLFALLMLLAGVVCSKYIVAYIFGGMPEPSISALALAPPTHAPRAAPRRTPTQTSPREVSQTPRPTAAVTAQPTKTAGIIIPTLKPTRAPVRATATRVPPVTATPAPTATRTPTVTVTPTFTATPTPTPLVTPTPTPGVLTLANYWVGSRSAAPGQTVAIGYVIDNPTGHTQRIFLGASIKPDPVLSWAQGEIDDPSHDVVAIVPPGETLHTRYFTLPASIRAGLYEVAWGLRDAASGSRLALVSASGALRVVR